MIDGLNRQQKEERDELECRFQAALGAWLATEKQALQAALEARIAAEKRAGALQAPRAC